MTPLCEYWEKCTAKVTEEEYIDYCCGEHYKPSECEYFKEMMKKTPKEWYREFNGEVVL